ncbi:type VI secretion system tip protein VgrG [Oxalicibacterium solurbis]|uniref:Type IV secretion protein Rhs n=1 Tax=Oxalicibacterium solurbis TaxID=69280 RepID=A0A8J3ATF7_9BURK|nr:type VI secretion system tip protein VgrG [Oxalicibacterium solurbis]GGI52865.1 type IV secretion protein Rhs [Oxalicibacterium solurbis]
MADSPAVGSSDVLKLTITSNGSPLATTIGIESVSINKSVNKVSMARIVIRDGDMPNAEFPQSDAADFVPGAAIVVSAGYGSTETSIFEGVIIRHSIKITGANHSRLIVECRDKAVGMTIGRKNANYVDQLDSDIISKLIGNCSGLSADVTATSVQHKELVQYYCTDWDYMVARAEVNGMLVTVDAAKVTVQPPAVSGSAVLTVTYGMDLMEFHADIDARTQLTSVQGTTWDLSTQAVAQTTASPKTLNAQGNLDSATLAGVIGLANFNLQTAVPLDTGSLQAWADGQQLKAGLSRIRGRMKFQGSALALPGALIEIKGVGARFSGNVFVSAVNHDIENGNWVTEVEFGMPHRWFVEQQDDVIAPPAAGLAPGVQGLQIGVVMKLDADPDGQYKIQVSTPVMQPETDGVWARLAGFYASSGFGSFFLPEIGDEVVLGYFNDDPSHPVILGSLYSSSRKPAYEPAAENNFKAIVTRSMLKCEFDDDKKIITLTTPAANKIVISDDAKSILLSDQNGNTLELKPDGIYLDSAKDIVMNAKGKVTITATGNIESTSQADIKSQGLNINNNANVGFVAKGAASAELSASGQTTVKGAMVMIN